MKYKVGDRVKVKSLQWFNENSDDKYNVVLAGGWYFSKPMSILCGKELIIKKISHADNTPYYIMEDNAFAWTDEMIEGLVEEDIIDIDEFQDDDEVIDIIDDYVHRLKNNECQINLPEGYQFVDENGNVINATKIVLEKKKKEYPKTYEECCYMLGFENTEMVFEDDYRDINPPKEQWKRLGLMNQFNKLLICRDAYWKIAGEEMGLGKPWKPDWENSEERRYSIVNIEGDINLPEKTLTKWILKVTNKILVFPTEEMRDAFYENFKELIESCKELL